MSRCQWIFIPRKIMLPLLDLCGEGGITTLFAICHRLQAGCRSFLGGNYRSQANGITLGDDWFG